MKYFVGHANQIITNLQDIYTKSSKIESIHRQIFPLNRRGYFLSKNISKPK